MQAKAYQTGPKQVCNTSFWPVEGMYAISSPSLRGAADQVVGIATPRGSQRNLLVQSNLSHACRESARGKGNTRHARQRGLMAENLWVGEAQAGPPEWCHNYPAIGHLTL